VGVGVDRTDKLTEYQRIGGAVGAVSVLTVLASLCRLWNPPSSLFFLSLLAGFILSRLADQHGPELLFSLLAYTLLVLLLSCVPLAVYALAVFS